MRTDIHVTYTDTYGGEANFGWVRRATITGKDGEDFSDRAAVRRAKAAIGLTGVRCRVENNGLADITLRPVGSNTVCFIAFHTVGRAS